MPYDQAFAERIRAILSAEEGVTEREMLGGLTFMINGNMLGGPRQETLIIRVGPDAYDEAIAQPEARHLKMVDFPMRGFVEIDISDLGDDTALSEWMALGINYAKSMPPK